MAWIPAFAGMTGVGVALLLLAGCHPPAWAEAAAPHSGSPAAYCRKVGTDDRLRPVPPDLVPAFQHAFALHAPAEYVERSGYIRCAHGLILGCTVGANLPCGPADTRRDIPGADAWCRENGNPPMIPAYVTGHASIYAWRCEGGRAVPVRQVAQADERGFVRRYWKVLPPSSPVAARRPLPPGRER